MPLKFNEATQKWVADYTDQFGKRHRHGYAHRKDAKAELVRREAEIQARQFRPDAQKTKLASVAEDYIESCKRRVRHGELDALTCKNYEGNIRRYVLGSSRLNDPRFPHHRGKYFPHPLGGVSIGGITAGDVVGFRANLRDFGLSAISTRAVVQCLGAVLGFAVDQNLLAVNVAKNLKRRRTKADRKKEIVPPEKAAIGALIAAATKANNSDLIIMFAALTGMRTSEQRALKWKCVDLDKGEARVEVRVNNLGQMGAPKSEAGTRTIPLAGRLVADLRAWKGRSKFNTPEDFVFPNRLGKAQSHPNIVNRHFNPAWTEARRTWKGEHPLDRCPWHSLRHFAISCWIERDVPLKQIQKWAGHSTASITLDVYSHLFKSATHANAMEDIVGEILPE